MEEWEQTAKQFKTNAEFLESLCQDKLTHMFYDKRKARKSYQEEHQRIALQFTNVSCSFKLLLLLLFNEIINGQACEWQTNIKPQIHQSHSNNRG